MVAYPGRTEPLTICMWDFSWLMCGHPGGSFEDLERRVEEAAERGYDTLRVDVFPNHYLSGEITFAQSASRRVRTWGDVLVPGGFTVDVRARVRELARLTRRYGLSLGLDTWQSGAIVQQARVPAGEEEAAARSIATAWCKAIPAMRDDGVLDRAVWLAPLNEVPLFLGMKLETVRVSDPEDRHEGMTAFRADLPELDTIFRDVNRWLGESVKEAIEADGIPLSYSALGAENYGARVTDIYDVVDVHFMPDLVLQPEDAAALESAGVGASKFSLHPKLATYDLETYSNAWNAACRRNYATMLALCHDYAQSATERLVTSTGKRLAGVVTEAYGPCNFPDTAEVDWSGYNRYNADAARIFSQYPFAGLTVSNHAEPIFRMWDEVELQRTTNLFVKSQI
jgi:pentose-5-phosphate-3-epimerase